MLVVFFYELVRHLLFSTWILIISSPCFIWSRSLTFQKCFCYLLDWKPFKNDEKCFLFYLKSSFCSQDIYVFVRNFWSCRKNSLITLASKFLMSQPGTQTIAIHILPNISQGKGNQTMKYGNSIEYNKRNIFLQKLCRKWGKETSSKPLFHFLKSLIWGDSKWSAA